jgi:hypothetical protein
MVNLLRLLVDIQSDETFESYVCRLGSINFQPSGDDFSRDMSTTLHSVAAGAADAIRRISAVSGVGQDVLRRSAFVRNPDRSRCYRGQKLTLHARAPALHRFCPACLQEDIEKAVAAGSRRPHAHCYGRAHWHVKQYRTCVRHGIRMSELTSVASSRQYDLIGAVEPLLTELPSLAAGPEQRTANGLERYIERRFHEESHEYLDRFGFSVCARFCEMLGAVAVYGPWPPHLGFTDEHWHAAGAAGYEIASRGDRAIRGFLFGLKNKDKRDSRDGPHADWGILYNWLEDTRDRDIEPLLELARDVAQSIYPIPAGRKLLHAKVAERRMHSVWSASIEHGIHVDVLRSQLSVAGAIDPQIGQFDNHILFPAALHQELLQRLARGITDLPARTRLNCERQIFPLLVAARIVSPIVDVESGCRLFDPVDLDQFMARMVGGAEPYEKAPEDMVSIAKARMKVGCSQTEIVRLVLDRRLTKLGTLNGRSGYASLLVAPDEIRPLVHTGHLGGIVITDIAKDFGIPHAGLVQLLDLQLPTEHRMHPVRRCMQQLVDQCVYDEFKSKFVSLRDLSRSAGLNAKTVMVQLRSNGILPEEHFPPGVYIYAKAKLP